MACPELLHPEGSLIWLSTVRSWAGLSGNEGQPGEQAWSGAVSEGQGIEILGFEVGCSLEAWS